MGTDQRCMSWRVFRYIFKEILPYFLLTLLVATAIIFAQEVGRFSELFIKRNVPPELVRTLLLAVLTRILIITLPISLLMGILLGLTRMSSDNEIVSLLASGLSRAQLLIPLLSLALPMSLLMGWFTLVEFPRSATRFREIRSQLIIQGIRTQVSPHVFDTRFVDRVLYIHSINRATDLWEGIFLVSLESGRPILLTGRQGLLELGDGPESSKLHLFDGVAHRIEPDQNGHEVYHLEGFSSYHVRFDPQTREAARFQLEIQRRPEPLNEKTINELLNTSKREHKTYIKAHVEAGRRLALPFVCLVFPPIGLALGVIRKPTGRPAGFVLGMALASAYYLLLFAAEKLARGHLLPPLLAMWLPNLIFAVLALLAWQGRLPFHRTWPLIWESLAERWQRLHHKLKPPQRTLIQAGGLKPWLPWVRLTDQYLITDFVRYFLLFLASLWLLFMVFTFFELSPDIIEHQIRTRDAAHYFLFLTPEIVQNLTPPCVLLASMCVSSIQTRTNQVTALKSGGISAYRIAAPILLSGLVLAAITGVWGNWVVPGANIRQEQLRFYIKKGRFPSPLELSPLSQEGNWVYGQSHRIFHFERFDRECEQFHHLWVLDLNPADLTLTRRIEATWATWDQSHSTWRLENARLWLFEKDRLIRSEQHEVLYLPLAETPAYFKTDMKKPAYMSVPELAAHISELKRSGIDVHEFQVALQRKIASPITCLVMTLVGVPFGFTLGRKGALYGIGLGIFLGLVYWLSLGFFEELGKYGYVDSSLAGWGPGILFGVLGLFVLFRVRT